MYENCNSDYYNIFIKQFIQTLAQFSAAIITSAVTVPVYSYYKRSSLMSSNEVYEFNHDNVEESENITEREVTEENDDDVSEFSSQN